MATAKKLSDYIPRRLRILNREVQYDRSNPTPLESHVAKQDIHPLIMEYMKSPFYQPQAHGVETEEEANDFHIEDLEAEDIDFESRYELKDMIELYEETQEPAVEGDEVANDHSTAAPDESVSAESPNANDNHSGPALDEPSLTG